MMIKKTTTTIIILCLMCSVFFAACSKKSTEEVQNPPEQKVEDKTTPAPEPPNELDILAQEATKPETKPDVNVKRSHPQRDFRVITPKTPGLDQNPILKEIPGDSFLILASTGDFNFERHDVADFFKHLSVLMLDQIKSFSQDSPLQKATRSFAQGIFKTFTPQKFKSLGIAGEVSPQFALYFVRQTPVLRIALSDADKFREIIESYWDQNGVETHRAENISSHWILVPIADDASAELAIRWESDRVTITTISSLEHAGFLLPDIMTVPDEKHTAYHTLANLETDDNAMIVGIFDDNGMLNQFAALQEQFKKLSDETENPFSNTCIKDFRRIADNIPRVILQMNMISGGSSAGIDLKLSFDVKMQDWIKELMSWKPQQVSHPVLSDMPVMQFSAALPMHTLLKGIKSIQENTRKEPFTCSDLTFLNEIELPEEAETISKQLDRDHFIGYTAYEMGEDESPTSYAASWHSEAAAEIAMLLGILNSDTLKKSLETTEDAPAAEGLNEAQDANENAGDTGEAKATETQTDVLEDAKLDLSEFFYFKSPQYQVKKDGIILTSDSKLLKKLVDAPLKPTASLFHISVSERMFEDDQDVDKDRDYQVSADISTTATTLDLTLRYVIE